MKFKVPKVVRVCVRALIQMNREMRGEGDGNNVVICFRVRVWDSLVHLSIAWGSA